MAASQKEELDKLKKEMINLHALNQALQQKQKKLEKGSHNEIEALLTKLHHFIFALTADKELSDTQVSEYQRLMVGLEEQNTACRTKFIALEADVANLKVQVENSNNEKIMTDDFLNAEKIKNQQLVDQIHSLDSNTDSQNHEGLEELELLKSTVSKLEQQNGLIMVRANKSEFELTHKLEEISDLKGAIEKLKEDLSESALAKLKVEEEKEQLSQKLTKMNDVFHLLKEKYSRLKESSKKELIRVSTDNLQLSEKNVELVVQYQINYRSN